MRFVIEGEWTGYQSSQRRVCHREVLTITNPKTSKVLKALQSLYSIPFSDGTSLVISVREARYREKVAELHGYTKLIRDAMYAEIDKQEKVEVAAPGAGEENAQR